MKTVKLVAAIVFVVTVFSGCGGPSQEPAATTAAAKPAIVTPEVQPAEPAPQAQDVTATPAVDEATPAQPVTIGPITAPAKTVQVCPANRYYWQYDGKPVLLLGGSVEDNLFQIPDVAEHLDLLKSVGGNYVRCTMSSRDEGNVWAFAKDGDKYDLNKFNAEYWEKFANFLKAANERDVIVQIEVWATFDFYREPWAANPFNPKNNVNYTAEQSGLSEEVTTHPTRTENNFFRSVPAENNQRTVLQYQQHFVDKLLSISLNYGNVLYCMDNETSVTPEWGKYWAEYIKSKAAEAGVTVQTTEMWDNWNLDHPQHTNTFDHPEIYSFVDISQNNHLSGQQHWDNAQKQRARIADNPRPLNNVKIYGADTGKYGTDRDGIERFWRNVFGGLASARFHRPTSGLGLNEKAQAHIKSMRMLTDRIDVFTCDPHNNLLSQREENEAYCIANPGAEYAVFFPDGGYVVLDTSTLQKDAKVIWLQISNSEWKDKTAIDLKASEKQLILRCPKGDYWGVLIK